MKDMEGMGLERSREMEESVKQGKDGEITEQQRVSRMEDRDSRGPQGGRRMEGQHRNSLDDSGRRDEE